MNVNELRSIEMKEKRYRGIFPGFVPQVLVTGIILFVGLIVVQI
jgi:hypothetical protein